MCCSKHRPINRTTPSAPLPVHWNSTSAQRPSESDGANADWCSGSPGSASTPGLRASESSAAACTSTTPPAATPSIPPPELETANKQLGTRICVSEGVVSRDPDFKGRPVGDPMLRGRAEPMRAYEPLSPGAYADPSIAAYLEAFRKPEAGDQSATPAFAALVGLRSDDQLAGFHLKRLLNGAVGIPFPAHTRGGFRKVRNFRSKLSRKSRTWDPVQNSLSPGALERMGPIETKLALRRRRAVRSCKLKSPPLLDVFRPGGGWRETVGMGVNGGAREPKIQWSPFSAQLGGTPRDCSDSDHTGP